MANATTRNAVWALYARRECKIGKNTEIYNANGQTYMMLHGSNIACLDEDGTLSITSAGWETHTTKERLNGLPGVQVHQHNWNWYLNGVRWENSDIFTEIQ